ncbi:MAG: M23 family metallopeptidase, partial [Oscillospiraceae bacterium]|nr:M23 family metallopeptidase [Oscillospiraceae bacterium]
MFIANRDECVRQEEAYQKQISAILAQLKPTSSEYVGGDLCWPVPGYYGITSPYGWRTFGGRRELHGGLDISSHGIYGANIVAANDGTVVFVCRKDSKGWGSYGFYVMIDHGGGVVTVYGHCSQIFVSVGQKVKKGQIIGAVGSTGCSTGPHLHFEYRVNGVRKDPMPMVKGKDRA